MSSLSGENGMHYIRRKYNLLNVQRKECVSVESVIEWIVKTTGKPAMHEDMKTLEALRSLENNKDNANLKKLRVAIEKCLLAEDCQKLDMATSVVAL